MKQHARVMLFLLPAFIFASFIKLAVVDEQWINLFNGRDLRGWDTWLGPPLDDNGKKITDHPVGLNNDPRKVFAVADHEGEKVIRIAGSEWGGISTASEYENYHLQLMFKWGTLVWGQKKGKKKDSGLLYHAVGEHGADYGAWMRSQEYQIQEGDCGDFWGVAGGIQDIPAVKRSDSDYVYSRSGQLYTFSATNSTGRHCIKDPDAEKPTGQWNTVDLYCHGDTTVHMINGKVVMILFNSRQWDNGKELPLIKGKIQLQSEGAEIFYKNIRLRSIKAIPVELLK